MSHLVTATQSVRNDNEYNTPLDQSIGLFSGGWEPKNQRKDQ